MNTYQTLMKRATTLAKRWNRLAAIDREREAISIKTQARRDHACGYMTFEQMCKVVATTMVDDD